MQLTPTQMQIALQAPLFSGIDPGEVAAWLNAGKTQVRSYAKGEIIRSPRRSLGIVCRGKVHVLKNASDGKPVLMNVLLPGQITGAAAVFVRQEEAMSRLVAAQRAALVFIPRDALVEIMGRHSILALNYISFLSERILFLNQKIVGFTGQSAVSRVAFYLRQMEAMGTQAITITYSDLAAMLNIGRASLYRAMDELERHGAIRRQGKTIALQNREILLRYTTNQED